MTIVYRTAGAWGPGKGANLTAAEIDGNFHDLNTRLTEVETNPPEPAEIQSITSSGSALTITVSDGRVIGPLAIGSAALVYKGNWLAATVYKKNDIVVANGSEVYYVAVDHTSAATFDAGRVISGTTVYQLMMNAYDAALEAVGWALTAGSHSGISFTEQPDGSVDAAVDFSAGMEAYQDAIATAFALGTKSGISITYDDTNNRFDFSVTITQYTDELAQDAAAALLTTGTHSGISFSYNDAGNALNATVSVAFADLTDVPSGYSGQGGRLLAVKGDASGLEFRSPNELVPPAAVPRFMGCMATLASSLIGVNYSAAANIPWTAEASRSRRSDGSTSQQAG